MLYYFQLRQIVLIKLLYSECNLLDGFIRYLTLLVGTTSFELNKLLLFECQKL